MKTNRIEELVQKVVSEEESGVRLDRCLRLWIPRLPQGLIEKAARKGILKVEGKKVLPKTRVEEGQTVSFPKTFLDLDEEAKPKEVQPLTQAERKWIKGLILYEDDDLLVLNKPAGLAVQSGTKQRKSLDSMLVRYYEDIKPRLVHRLDKDTSGVLVIAKTLPMARWLTQAFKERGVQKTYWAVVCGVPKQPEGVIALALSKKADSVGEKVRVDAREGAHATTHYRTLDTLSTKVALLELIPKTGRMHQLRVHCAEGLKTPILGDGKYGGIEAFPLGRKELHLHARAITIPLPKGKSKTFEASVPSYFQETCNELGLENV
ncbi:MAG: RluA family pseudouridine synthase [Alphaproteobacteria bacterium]|nr:RluA family pseudouridine synthase [Alphaproteobacteria bacterium]